jgi:hypothetical protein
VSNDSNERPQHTWEPWDVVAKAKAWLMENRPLVSTPSQTTESPTPSMGRSPHIVPITQRETREERAKWLEVGKKAILQYNQEMKELEARFNIK